MTEKRPIPKPDRAPSKDRGEQTVIRLERPDPRTRAALIAEAERIMGVAPIHGRTGLRPGY